MTRILIVDDEEKIRNMIRKYAEYEGFQTDEAKDGLEAVQKCEKNNYDLCVMDIMMPNLDGFSAVKEIKKTHPRMPFIMLSALGEEYDKIHGFDIGVDDYVVKPQKQGKCCAPAVWRSTSLPVPLPLMASACSFPQKSMNCWPILPTMPALL